MRLWLLLVTALASPFLCYGLPGKCNPEIIKRISELWEGNNPRNITETEVGIVKSVTVGTTHGYFPKDTQCVYALATNGVVAIVYVYENGDWRGVKINWIEIDGYVKNPETYHEVHYVVLTNEVIATYICDVHGEGKNDVAIIRVKDGYYDNEKVLAAKHKLESCGLYVTDVYPKCCCEEQYNHH
uniref:Lipocalin/cytosolic fatty-acid binding domain-containing protein n=1 Tax=Graphocephala atropunctata TaxID=36148 RepID=A0A1B6KS91_9HEMI